jgi:hypothetical protein
VLCGKPGATIILVQKMTPNLTGFAEIKIMVDAHYLCNLIGYKKDKNKCLFLHDAAMNIFQKYIPLPLAHPVSCPLLEGTLHESEVDPIT